MSGTERNLLYVKGHREKGICGYSGCHVESGDFFHCVDHRLARKKYMRDWRLRKKEAASAVRPAAP